MTTLLTPDELETKLRNIGTRRYHRLHPFIICPGGKCRQGPGPGLGVQPLLLPGMIPVKDASLIRALP